MNRDDFVARTLVQALRWRIMYENAEPDVGMGSPPEYYLDSILSECEMGIDNIMRNRILNDHKRYER